MREALKVGVSGVRGIVGKSFSPQVATEFAQAFGTFVGRGPVVVGRDTRTTGMMVENAVIAGLQSVGCQPLLAGIVPTPTVLILTKELKARGGIAITASHNPVQWNALKFIGDNALFLNELRAEELINIYHSQEFNLTKESEIPEVAKIEDPMNPHYKKIADYVDLKKVSGKKFKVAIDCCNGVGAIHSVPFLRDYLSCEVISVLDKPTGAFEREPEPTPESLTALCEAVRRNGCDIGFAQDPDGDRLAIVDENGEPLGEDFTLTLGIQQVLNSHKKGPVAVNLSSGKTVDYVTEQANEKVTRTKIGEINVSETMLEIGAVAGGESNGGLIIPAVHPCRDSYVSMAIILEMLADSGKSISALKAAIPEYHIIKEKIKVSNDASLKILRAVRQHYQNETLNLLDGVHVDFGDSWIHARRSNTEPVIRVMAEAPTREKAEKLADELKSIVNFKATDDSDD